MTNLEDDMFVALNRVFNRTTESEAKAAAEVAKRYIEDALTYAYHVAKDEDKGIRSAGYGTRFKQKYGI